MDLKLTNFNIVTSLVKECLPQHEGSVIRENILRLLGKNESHFMASL
jgi:hypothetical protein